MRGGPVGVSILGILATIPLAGSGCGNKTRQTRAGDAAPVEVVHEPTAPQTSGSAAGSSASDEVEPNDGDDTATPLLPGATLRGRIEPETDVDYYRIDVKEAGALAVEVSGVEGVDLILEVADAGGVVLVRSDRGGARIREGIPNLGVTPGRYTAIVRSKKLPPAPIKPVKKPKGKAPVVAPAAAPAATTVPVYELTAHVTAPVAASTAEREPDDDRGTALDLIVGDTVTGYLGWLADLDVWKLSVETLSEKNAIDVEVSAVEGVALSVEVADGIGRTLLVRKAPRGAPLAIRGLVPLVPAGAPPFHYLTIKGDRSNPETPYQLRVSAKVLGTDVEIEPDDSLEHAMAVPSNRTIVHATWTPGDVDCFALPADTAARTIEIEIGTPAEADLSAELLVDGKVVAKGEHPGKGAAETVKATVPAGVTPILRVRGTETSAEGSYDVTIQEGPAAP